MERQVCQSERTAAPYIPPGSFGNLPAVEMLAAMATLGERVAHALRHRGVKPTALDQFLAERFGKKGKGHGYSHRILHRGQQPAADVCAAIAEFLGITERWLLTGEGPMERGAHDVPTYDSLTGWAAAAEAEAKAGRVVPYAIRAAGRSPAFVRPETVTPDFVFRCAMFWLEHSPEPDREAAMKAEVQRLKSEDARKAH